MVATFPPCDLSSSLMLPALPGVPSGDVDAFVGWELAQKNSFGI